MTNRLSTALKVALGCLSGGCLVALMGVTVIDVFGRYILNAPLLGGYELSETAIGIVVAVALPLVALADGHIRLTLLDRLLGASAVRLRDGLSAILFAGASGILAWRMLVELENAAALGKATDLLGIPRAPVLGLIAVMFALSAVIGLLNLFTRRASSADPVAATAHRPEDSRAND